jgi:hypothetical protein
MIRSILWLSFAPALLAVAPEPTPQELEANRRRWAQLQQTPERAAAIRQAFKTFQTFSAERREAIQQLDHDLQQPEGQPLREVLARYVAWIETLSAEDREKIRQAPNRQKKLALIRSLREQDWIKHQPKATRDRLAELKEKERTDAIAVLKADEKKRRFEWTIAQRFWKELEEKRPLPSHVADLPTDVQTYVQDYLFRLLTAEEKDRLLRAEGQWPLFPMTLVELADRHPPALPGAEGPRFFADLPKGVQLNIKVNMALKTKFVEGRWPEFAIKMSELAAKRGVAFPHEWWAFGYKALSEPMQKFLDTELKPKLDREDLAKLARAEGRWPEYPETLQKLAAQHHLDPPWFTLPRDRKQWDAYRLKPEMRAGK